MRWLSHDSADEDGNASAWNKVSSLSKDHNSKDRSKDSVEVGTRLPKTEGRPKNTLHAWNAAWVHLPVPDEPAVVNLEKPCRALPG